MENYMLTEKRWPELAWGTFPHPEMSMMQLIDIDDVVSFSVLTENGEGYGFDEYIE